MRKLLPIILAILICQNSIGQTFTLDIELPTGLRGGSVSWGDINNDGNLDFIQTGNDIDGQPTTRLYINKSSSFELLETDLRNIIEGASDWGDYDNDGDIDLLLAGSGTDGVLTGLYDNIDGVLVLNESVSLHGIDRGSVEWGDYDKDGDLDILLSGQGSGSNSVTKMYNNESGAFTETGNTITGVSFGVASWLDFDNDGDLDIIISGVTGTAPNTGPKVTELYENTGSSFSIVFEDSFEGLSHSSMDFGDYDNDGDLDILLAGYTNSGAPFTAIYQNNGSTFDIVFDGSLPNVMEGQVLWGDSDNDGDLDAFISGNMITGKIAKLYSNTGSGFELEFSFNEAGQSAAEFGDYDSDGDIDLFISGQRNDFTIYSAIYKNDNSNETLAGNSNTVPNAPSNLVSQIEREGFLLSWDLASDNNTPQSALSYALYLRNDADTLISVSSLSNGKRKEVTRGNSGNSNSYRINRKLEVGEYFWSVQTIDNSFDGSAFASEESFQVINFPPIIEGAISTLSTPEETSLLIEIQDLVIDDPDNEYPADFTLVVLDGDNYSVASNAVTPDAEFIGVLEAPIIVNDGTDNSEPFTLMIEVTKVLGLNNQINQENFSIFPNPVRDYLNIVPSDASESYALEIFGLNGTLIKSNHEALGENKIDLSLINGGIFILKVLSGNKVTAFLIMKN